jgi:8-oxo-dGTP pyrophosphatase MutT (NUDIX family)
MNYDIDINELDDEKIIIPKKNYYCSNCNRKGHTFKSCNEPIISNGIIAVYIKNFESSLIPFLEEYINCNMRIFSNKKPIKSDKNIIINIMDTDGKLKFINDNIEFLMVQRKSSLGYLEFIRGRYPVENFAAIEYLLEQMTPEEVKNIIELDFDILWNNLWDNENIRNKNHFKEYIVSKQKFYQVKLKYLDKMKNIKTLYDYNEWGFPKGRREQFESDVICAMREFEEETGLNDDSYNLLENSRPIKENLIGTNNISYMHNYFVAILNSKPEEYKLENREIGDLKIMNINDCLEVIRPYHKNKQRVIKGLYILINNFLKEYSNVEFL